MQPRKIFMTDRHRIADWRAACAHLSAGDALILRDYDAPQRAREAKIMAAYARAHGLIFLVGGDARLAARLGAGLHLPRFRATARHAAPRPRITSMAVHNHTELIAAARLGADIAIISPIFPTDSHATRAALGVVRFWTLARQAHALGLRVFALGGMDMAAWRRCTGLMPAGAAARADGFAAISAFG